ncbi:NAD-dependent epimerase [Pluralibacter gergoviae]|nr:NAD-dependent epimerase [Pluralibacter gergoviae]
MILVTGAAGFIGYHLCKRLLIDGYDVFGIDNLNDYYDVNLKKARLSHLTDYDKFTFLKIDISDKNLILDLFDDNDFSVVINLAAQAGVRFSIENPYSYSSSNLLGFLNILEGCRLKKVSHLLYASSSSVYGLNTKVPFSTADSVDHPISFYAATKKSNELMAHTYSHLFGIPTSGLRFFTVYGPYGRPDMALFKFTKSAINGDAIEVYNNGNMSRDFTYIDDIIESIIRLIDKPPLKHEELCVGHGSGRISSAPYRILNIGSGNPIKLMDFIDAIENKLNVSINKKFLPLQDGDVLNTYAETDELYDIVKFKPTTSVQQGVSDFIDWYISFYGIAKNTL